MRGRWGSGSGSTLVTVPKHALENVANSGHILQCLPCTNLKAQCPKKALENVANSGHILQ
eukprot:2238714-Rhodomonas_salina.1